MLKDFNYFLNRFKHYIREAELIEPFDEKDDAILIDQQQQFYDAAYKNYINIGVCAGYNIMLNDNYIYAVKNNKIILVLEFSELAKKGMQVIYIVKLKEDNTTPQLQWKIFSFLLEKGKFKYILTGEQITTHNKKSHETFIKNNTNLHISLYNTMHKLFKPLNSIDDLFKNNSKYIQMHITKLD